jgi:hypothetical protein
MRCVACGREHENVWGKCPFCSTSPAILQRQRERPSNTGAGWTFRCKVCGQEITEWETIRIDGFPEEFPIGHEKCFENQS